MIVALIAASARHLMRDRISLVLTFLLPLAFFSVTALAFGGSGLPRVSPVALHVEDLDVSRASRELLAALRDDPTLALHRDATPCPSRACAIERSAAWVESRRATGVMIVPAGFGAMDTATRASRLEVLVPGDEPVAAGIATRAIASALHGGPTPRPMARRWPAGRGSGRSDAVRGALSGLLVVFLLFTATGASGWLIEEEQQGTLSLLLTTRAGLIRILTAQWLFLLGLGALQALVMLVWACSAFALGLSGAQHLGRVALVTLATAGVTASVGLCIATAARTRAQLGAISTLTILLLSAVGGSFVPRDALPGPLRAAGLASPTTWAVAGLWQALDGDGSLAAVLPATLALVGFSGLFLATASAVARRRVVA